MLEKRIKSDSDLLRQKGLHNTVIMAAANTDVFVPMTCHESIKGTENETVVIEVGESVK